MNTENTSTKTRKITLLLIVILIATLTMLIFDMVQNHGSAIKVKVLIIPKFEIGDLAGDTPGEAQYYYEGYCQGGEEYEINDGQNGKVYVKDGIALYISGMGKVNSSVNVTRLLDDNRFDFTDSYIVSTGCAGGAVGTCVMGDVVIGTGVADFDLGHHAESRELENSDSEKWYHDSDYDYSAYKYLNKDLTNQIYELTKDITLETTPATKQYMANSFDNAAWACREPKVLKGSVVSGDNYWKGQYDHDSCIKICETYALPDPYSVTEMEDVALALVAEKYGLLDKYIIIRDIVDEDIFMNGSSPERLWDPDYANSTPINESEESSDIFDVAMKNNFLVGKEIIDWLVRE